MTIPSGVLLSFLLLHLSSRAFADYGLQVSKLPFWKLLNQPFFSLDGTHVELFTLLFFFMITTVVMNIRMHRQLMRHVVQIISLLVFFYIVFSCLGVFGMIRNTLHGISLIGTVYTESFFWMSLPVCVIAFSITSGPYFCGWICPTGTIQEFFSIARERLVGKRPIRPTKLNLTLIGIFFGIFLYLVFNISEERKLFVEDSSLYWAASIILITFLVIAGLADDIPTRSLRWVSFFSIFLSSLLKVTITSPVHFAFVDVLDPASAITTLILAVASLFISRGWCRYLCPWGLVMSQTHRFSRLKVVHQENCRQCGACIQSCRVGAVEAGRVRSEHCQFCFACVDVCPEKAIKVMDMWKSKSDPITS